MLRFLVHDERGLATQWPLVNAHLLGSDDTSRKGGISFRDGCITCKTSDPHAAHAFSLEVDAGRAGRLMLQTCLLRQREDPYRLYEELARHRIKLFLEKSENWLFLDPAKAPEAFEKFEQARTAFVMGMTEPDPVRSELLHRDALALGIFASEQLVMKRTEWQLHRRFGAKVPDYALGIRVPIEKAPEQLAQVLSSQFDTVRVPTPWSLIEPTQGKFSFDQVDRWMAWAKKSGRKIIAGPLLDAGAAGVPGWVRPSLSDPAKLKDRLYPFIREVVARYAPLNPIWNTAASVHLNEAAPLSTEAMVHVTRMAGVTVRQLVKNAKLLVEVGDPFSDIPPATEGAIGAIVYIRALLAEGVPMDMVGLPVLLGGTAPGQGARDLMQICAMVERFTSRKEMPPIVLSACAVPSAPQPDAGTGWWREPWSARSQGAWAPMVFQIALANPNVHLVVWDRLRDDAGYGIRDSGLFAPDGSPKPAAERLLATRRRLRTPLGPFAGAGADASGAAAAGSGD